MPTARQRIAKAELRQAIRICCGMFAVSPSAAMQWNAEIRSDRQRDPALDTVLLEDPGPRPRGSPVGDTRLRPAGEIAHFDGRLKMDASPGPGERRVSKSEPD